MGNWTQFFCCSGTISTARDPRFTRNGTSSKRVDFVISGRFHGQLHTVFWSSGQFQQLMTPGTRKLGRRQTSSILSILAVFVGYSTQFLAPETISTARDPRYMKIGTSSKLVDLVIAGRFCGLWHTVFWLRRRFQPLVTPGKQKLGRRQNSSFWSFLAIFVGYST